MITLYSLIIPVQLYSLFLSTRKYDYKEALAVLVHLLESEPEALTVPQQRAVYYEIKETQRIHNTKILIPFTENHSLS